jgi:hypothetical protein
MDLERTRADASALSGIVSSARTRMLGGLMDAIKDGPLAPPPFTHTIHIYS